MEAIAVDLSPTSMVRAIVDSLLSFVEVVGAAPGIEKLPAGREFAYISDIPFPMFNGLIGPWFTPQSADASIEAIIAETAARHVSTLWWVTPDSEPADIRERLVAHGFQRQDQCPGMAIDLAHLGEEDLPDGVTIDRVRTLDDLDAWGTVLFRGYPLPDEVFEPYMRIMQSVDLGEDTSFQSFIASLHGVPVATSTVVYGRREAGIYNVVTLPDFRGRGIGRAITLAPLLEARRRGYRIGVLHASDMGLPVYRRLGFKEYCTIDLYLWLGEADVTGCTP